MSEFYYGNAVTIRMIPTKIDASKDQFNLPAAAHTAAMFEDTLP
jgi:hypothetical protein